MSYSPRKAAQTIAFFSVKNDRRPINTLKAVKLVYLADRASVEAYGCPIQEERRVAMPLGPVNSTTYEYIKGEIPPEFDEGWSDFLTDRRNHRIGLAKESTSVDELDELSDADLAILEGVWERFGHMDQWELVDWTHDQRNVPEWSDPNGSSKTIPLEAMMAAVGFERPSESVDELTSISKASDFLRSL